ncbi:MAG: peptidase inhibitor family I36 protein [Vicinamibacterales bacterium]
MFVIVASLLSATCTNSMPTSPSELSTGLVIYEHANCLGTSAHVTNEIADLKDFEGPCVQPSKVATPLKRRWNDCVSSIRIATGWRATVYHDDNFTGQSLEVAGVIGIMAMCEATLLPSPLRRHLTPARRMNEHSFSAPYHCHHRRRTTRQTHRDS